MKWATPRDGDTRTLRRFLWLPLEIDHEVRWLEVASWTQRYCTIVGGTWEDLHWE
jgi:hypothetical protein